MSKAEGWKINSPLQVLKQRAFLLSEIRSFFKQRNVMEVETPILSSAANTDLQIDVFSTQAIADDNKAAYLRTSPEFFHKRLLSSGCGDIFEIAKVFRSGEQTQLHNPEFTMLEWYRLGYDLTQLMAEVVELIQALRQSFKLHPMNVVSYSYQKLFQKYLGIDPFDIDDDQLNQSAKEVGYCGSYLTRSAALDFMFGVKLEPILSNDTGYLIYDFPIEQAALAQPHPKFSDRCLRFEFLWGSTELANGYFELTDAVEQRLRFNHDNQLRATIGKAILPMDEHLISALESGLPDCSGVAVGIDRLLMCLLEKQDIKSVLPFSAANS